MGEAQELNAWAPVGLSSEVLLAIILSAAAAALIALLVAVHRVWRRKRAREILANARQDNIGRFLSGCVQLGKGKGVADSMHESMTMATAFTKVNVQVSATAHSYTSAVQPEIYI